MCSPLQVFRAPRFPFILRNKTLLPTWTGSGRAPNGAPFLAPANSHTPPNLRQVSYQEARKSPPHYVTNTLSVTRPYAFRYSLYSICIKTYVITEVFALHLSEEPTLSAQSILQMALSVREVAERWRPLCALVVISSSRRRHSSGPRSLINSLGACAVHTLNMRIPVCFCCAAQRT